MELVDVLLEQPSEDLHVLLDKGASRRSDGEPVEVKVKVDVDVDEPDNVTEDGEFEKQVHSVVVNILQDMLANLKLEKPDKS